MRPFLFLLLAIPTTIFSQLNEDQTAEGIFCLRTVVEFDSINASKIYIETEKRLKRVFSESILPRISDKEEGVIIFEAQSAPLVYRNISKMKGGHFDFSCEINIKDGKMRLTFYDLIHCCSEMVFVKDGSSYNDEIPSTWKLNGLNRKQAMGNWSSMKENFLEQLNYIATELSRTIVIDDF